MAGPKRGDRAVRSDDRPVASNASAPSDDRPIEEIIAELRGLDVPALIERYEATHGRPPRVKHRDWLWRRVAWKVQEQRYGGLREVARRKLDELIADLDLPLVRERVAVGKVGRSNEPPVGSSVRREWKGREIVATRTEAGWEYEGVVYRSLSAVAKAATGSHWSGPAFFGLRGGTR